MAKVDPKKAAADAKKAASAAKDKLQNNAVGKAASDVFAKIKAKAPDNKRVDEWQKKWLEMPEHRAKYEHLKDAPKVVGEELFAMTNDIIDFCQRQGGEGHSHIFKSIKENVGGFLKHPAEFLKKRAEEGKKKAMEAKDMATKKAGEAKKAAGKGGSAVSGAGLGGLLSKAKAGLGQAKEKAMQAKDVAAKKAGEAKKMAEKKTGEAKKVANKAKATAEKAKKKVKK